ncbi:unnamed protein product [Lampetra planeri]
MPVQGSEKAGGPPGRARRPKGCSPAVGRGARRATRAKGRAGARPKALGLLLFPRNRAPPPGPLRRRAAARASVAEPEVAARAKCTQAACPGLWGRRPHFPEESRGADVMLG